MAANKYLQVGTSGFSEEIQANDVSAGVGDAGKVVALDSTGKISPTMLPAGLGSDSVSTTAGEALNAGDLVYFDSTGKALKADARAIGKAAIGFALAAAALSAAVIIYFEGQLTGLTGLTAGAAYFLSDSTTGAATLTPPTTSGYIVQYIGRAVSTTSINFEADLPIKRA